MQGDATEQSSVNEIRKAVKNGDETTVRLLNYRKDGTPFWNMLSIAPINDADGVLRFYIGVQARTCPAQTTPCNPHTGSHQVCWCCPRAC